VPRGRVYANYVSRCANERVTVLNPASFGKLVRVLFPGLKTRRLGVRGESKYHYVNFSLKDDQPELPESQGIQSAQNFNDPPGFAQSFRYVLSSPNLHHPAYLPVTICSLTRNTQWMELLSLRLRYPKYLSKQGLESRLL
jgi:hypothetical protein